MRKYYEAYEERYKQVHKEGLLWAIKGPTEELIKWVKANKIPKNEEIYEMGCGEGRNAIFLAKEKYTVFAVDVSKAAIKKCKQISEELPIRWKVADNLKYLPTKKYNYVFSVGVLHMLVLEKEHAICDKLNVYLVTKKHITVLHKEFFEDESPTDCISFPIHQENFLGEIFVCPKVAVEYAKNHNLNPLEETYLYILHGLLHLLGYDDLNEKDKITMRKKEKKYMKLFKEHDFI